MTMHHWFPKAMSEPPPAPPAPPAALQPKPALTDEERAAILAAADLLIGSKPGATLRKLLERLHT
jgi:hypothetical protein